MPTLRAPRRQVLLSIAGSAALLSSPARAYEDCWHDAVGQEICAVGIKSSSFRRVGAYQETMVWCWAAVLQMIFRWHGKRISQTSIVEQTYGAAIPTTIDPFSLVDATKRSYYDDDGERFSVRSRIFSADFGYSQLDNCDIIRSLRTENPLIICNMSHMMVLIGATYNANVPCSVPNIAQAWVADPFPSPHWAPDMGPGFRDLHPLELRPPPLGQLRFLADIRVR